MAQVMVAMIDPEMTRSYGEPLPRRNIISSVFDHLTCENLPMKLTPIKLEDPTPEKKIEVNNAPTNIATTDTNR